MALNPLEICLRFPLAAPGPRAVRGLAAWLRRVDALAPTLHAPASAYLLLTPLGSASRAWLRRELGRVGVRVHATLRLRGWPHITSAVQARRQGARALRTGALYAAAWSRLFGDAPAEAWAIDPAQLGPLARHKAKLRATMPTLVLDVRPRVQGLLALHPFHLADPGDGVKEARRLEAAVQLLGRRAPR